MTKCVALALVLACTSGAFAQYSSDPFNNLTLADQNSEQVLPKLVATPDGGCYVSWFDNRSGGYDVYLQRLDSSGVEQWPHNGILLRDRGVSSTVDYDLSIDSSGNAIIAYNDDQAIPGTQQVGIQKISPAGVLLWGPVGITLSTNSTFKGNPQLAVLPSGNIAVAWSEDNLTWRRQKVDANGTPLWAAGGIAYTEASHYVNLADLQPGLGDTCIALWVRGTTTNPNTSAKALYTQSFDASGTAVWNSGNPVIVFNTTSIQNGYFPPIIADGSGGAVYAWYEIGGTRNAYLQHVLNNGTLKFAAPVAVSADTSRIRIGAGLSYDPSGPTYYIAWPESATPTQGNYSVGAQKFDASGARMWGNGVVILPTGTGNQPSFVQSQVRPGESGGCYVFTIDSRTATTGVVYGAGVSAAGAVEFGELISASIDTKSRLTSLITGGQAVAAWGNHPFGSVDIQVQNIRTDGGLGPPPPPSCDPDVNQDGNVDQDDVSYLINVVGGGENPTNIDPDFNHDGNVDQDDISALINVVAGGNCP